MLRPRLLFSAALLAVTVLAGDRTAPPSTRTDNITDVLHGVKITDPYRWLEDQKSPETRAWIEAQTLYARGFLDVIPGRDALRQKLERLLKVDVTGIPRVHNGRYFFTRRMAKEDRFSICMRSGFEGKDEVLVDPGTLDGDATTSVSLLDVSKDGTMLAYGVRHGGEDEVSVRLLNVDTRKPLPDSLPRARYFGVAIEPGKRGLYYARSRVEQGTRVFHHVMDADTANDQEIFGKAYGPEQLTSISVSEDERYLLFDVATGVPPKKVELYFQDLGKGGPIRPIVNNIEAEFRPILEDGKVYLWTNWKAPNWRIMLADLSDPAPEKWREIVPEGEWPISQVTPAGHRLFVAYLENVITRIKQFDPAGKYLGDFKLPGIGSAFVGSGRWDSKEAFYAFTSFVEPGTSYRFDVATGKQDVWFRPKIPVDSGNFEVKQVWYESKDKTRVPMFLVSKRGLKLDGNRPVLLTGYGGFDLSLTPAFSAIATVWTEMGGVFAIPNLRGGGEFGEKWHRGGMFEHKQNVFDDFIGAAEWLVRHEYTKPSRLAIQGGSNGGLLVGAAVTQRPDLFGAVICGAPLLDMLRYQKFKVGGFWVSEYGSADDPKQFAYIYKYSPYQHVTKGAKYPAVLFMTGDADTRVDPLHARKMTALMQASTGSDKPVMLRYDTKVGHTGGTSVDTTIAQTVDWMSFVSAVLGVPIG